MRFSIYDQGSYLRMVLGLYGLTFEDTVETTHIFPTLAEGAKLTAQAFLRNIDATSCCVE